MVPAKFLSFSTCFRKKLLTVDYIKSLFYMLISACLILPPPRRNIWYRRNTIWPPSLPLTHFRKLSSQTVYAYNRVCAFHCFQPTFEMSSHWAAPLESDVHNPAHEIIKQPAWCVPNLTWLFPAWNSFYFFFQLQIYSILFSLKSLKSSLFVLHGVPASGCHSFKSLLSLESKLSLPPPPPPMLLQLLGCADKL